MKSRSCSGVVANSKNMLLQIKLSFGFVFFLAKSAGFNDSDLVGMAIYDGMKLCRADISTVCVGLAANVAAFILACGTRGKRLCMPNSRVMIQQPFSAGGGAVRTAFITLLFWL